MKGNLRHIALYTALIVSIYAFYALSYWGHMNYFEQMQLFTPTQSYILEYLKIPGGINTIFSQWLTQWYFNSWVGSLIPAMICTTFAFFIGKEHNHNPFVAIGSAFALFIFCFSSKDYMVAGATAITIAVAFIFIGRKIDSAIIRMLLGLILSLFAGPFAGLIYALATIRKFYEIVPCFIVFFIFKSFINFDLSSQRIFMGTEFNRLVHKTQIEPFLISGFVLAMYYLKKLPWKRVITISQWGISLVLVVVTIISLYINRDEEIYLRYDKLARNYKWEEILKLEKTHPLMMRPTVLYTNLALAQLGQIGNDLFKHLQSGPEGLIPPFIKEADYAIMASDIYYHIGLINTAERFAWEGEESTLNGQRSVRAIKRIAQCNIIKENYPVARRFLAILKNTSCYRKWAIQAEEYINNKTTNKVAEWETIRSRMIKEDLFYSAVEVDKILARMFLNNPQNMLAYNYVLSNCLLKKDLNLFMQIFRPNIFGRDVPKYYKEAYLYEMGRRNHDSLKGFSGADQLVIKRIHDFINIYQANPKDKRLNDYKDSYLWYLSKQ